MHKQDSVRGIEPAEQPQQGKDCGHCVKGKMARGSMKSKTAKAKKPGETVYTYVCVPISFASLGGARYFVTWTDEFSGYKRTSRLRQKSDVRIAFQTFVKGFERPFETNVKLLYCYHWENSCLFLSFLKV